MSEISLKDNGIEKDKKVSLNAYYKELEISHSGNNLNLRQIDSANEKLIW